MSLVDAVFGSWQDWVFFLVYLVGLATMVREFFGRIKRQRLASFFWCLVNLAFVPTELSLGLPKSASLSLAYAITYLAFFVWRKPDSASLNTPAVLKDST